MLRQKASDFHPEVLRLFDAYVHGGISRRAFIDKAGPFTSRHQRGRGLGQPESELCLGPAGA